MTIKINPKYEGCPHFAEVYRNGPEHDDGIERFLFICALCRKHFVCMEVFPKRAD